MSSVRRFVKIRVLVIAAAASVALVTGALATADLGASAGNSLRSYANGNSLTVHADGNSLRVHSDGNSF